MDLVKAIIGIIGIIVVAIIFILVLKAGSEMRVS